MSTDPSPITVYSHVKLEKRNDAGELYETVEIVANGDLTYARVIQRKAGLAPDEAYAPGTFFVDADGTTYDLSAGTLRPISKE